MQATFAIAADRVDGVCTVASLGDDHEVILTREEQPECPPRQRLVVHDARNTSREAGRRSYVEWMNDPFLARRAILLASALALAPFPSVAAGQVSNCLEAARFLGEDRGMAIITEPDTIDDWRTGKRQPGCRVTAAGLTQIPIAEEAVRFYEHVRRAGWTRTPDPRDSPGESSLRFRKRERDCLFNVYGSALLGTEAERKVGTATQPRPGVSRYYVFVLCMTAQPAKPRRQAGIAVGNTDWIPRTGGNASPLLRLMTRA